MKDLPGQTELVMVVARVDEPSAPKVVLIGDSARRADGLATEVAAAGPALAAVTAADDGAEGMA